MGFNSGFKGLNQCKTTTLNNKQLKLWCLTSQ